MNNLKYRPMAVSGFSALAIIFAALCAGKAFLFGTAALCFGAVLTVIVFTCGKSGSFTAAAYFCAALIFSGVLLISYDVFCVKPAEKYCGSTAEIVGSIDDKSIISDNFEGYTVKVETVNDERIDASMILYIASDSEIEPGCTVKFKAEVKKPFLGDDLNSRLHLISGNILLSAFISDGGSMTVVKDTGNSLKSRIYQLRSYIRSTLTSLLPGESGAVACAMLLGDKSGLSDETAMSFSLTGISHLFAVSGLHLSVWVLSAYELLRKLHVNRYLNAAAADVFIVFFMALTGFTPSVSRAGVMLFAVMTGRLISSKSDPYNSLGLACIILLAAKPYCAVSISLLLSFSSTLGIVSLYPFLDRQIFKALDDDTPGAVRNFLNSVISLILVSLCAVLFTLPVSAFITGEISLLAPAANLFVSYAAAGCMICAGIAAVFGGISFISFPAAFLCGIFSKYILSVADVLSKSSVSVVKLNNVFVKSAVAVLISGIVIILMLVPQNRKRVKAAALLSAVVLTASCLSFAVYNHSRTTIDIFNAGDGLCADVKSGTKSMAIGCGGSDYYSSYALAHSLGSSADLLIIPDENRSSSGSALYLSSKCRFKKVICGYDSFGVDTMFENAGHYSSFIISPWDSASVEFYNENGNCFAYCVFGSNDILFIFSSSKDFCLPEKYAQAQVLVLSCYPPESVDIGKFGSVIFSASGKIEKKFAHENPDADFICTSDYNIISLDFKSGKIKINGR